MKLSIGNYSNGDNLENCKFEFARYLSGKLGLINISNGDVVNKSCLVFSYKDLIELKNEKLVIPYYCKGVKVSKIYKRLEFSTPKGFLNKLKNIL